MKLGTPLSPAALRVMLLGAGELGKEVIIALQRLGVEVIAVDRYPNAPGHQVGDGDLGAARPVGADRLRGAVLRLHADAQAPAGALRHAADDADLADRLQPLPVLAADRDDADGRQDRPVLRHRPDHGGDLRLAGAGAGLLPDHLAAAAPPGGHHRADRGLADRRHLHPDLQRAAQGRQADGAGGDGDRLAARQAQHPHPRRRPARGVPRVRGGGRRQLGDPQRQPPRLGLAGCVGLWQLHRRISLLFYAAGLALFLSMVDVERNYWKYLWVGAFFGLSFTFRANNIGGLFAIIGAVIWYYGFKRQYLEVLRLLLATLAGFALPLILWSLYFAIVGAAGEMIFASILFNFSYASAKEREWLSIFDGFGRYGMGWVSWFTLAAWFALGFRFLASFVQRKLTVLEVFLLLWLCPRPRLAHGRPRAWPAEGQGP